MARKDAGADQIDNDIEEPLLTTEGKDAESSAAPPPPVPFLGLFAQADRWDWILMTIGSLSSVGVGIVMPLFSLVFGGILDAFYGSDAAETVDRYSLYFVYLALASFLLNISMSCCFSISSERQIRRMR